MISFRYHVVSLVAVFLALGLGTLFGTYGLDRGVIETLNRNQRRLEERNRALRDGLRALEQRSSHLEEHARRTKPIVVRGVLANRAVTIVALERSDRRIVEQMSETFVEAGAHVRSSIRLSDRLDLSSEARRQQLAALLGAPTPDPVALAPLLVERISAALTGRAPGLLARLVEAGLAETGPVAPLLPAGTGAPGELLVVLGEEGPQVTRLEERVALPLIRSLAAAPAIVAVAEPGTRELTLLSPVRREAGLRIVTVDGVETPSGQVALVLGLEAALAGRFGHYGSGEGATGILPEARPGG